MKLTRVLHTKNILLMSLIAFLFVGTSLTGTVFTNHEAFRVDMVDVTASSSTTTMYVDPPSIVNPTLTPGTTFPVDVNIADVEDLGGWTFYMKWNGPLLNVTSVTEGPFLKSGGSTYFVRKIYNEEDYIYINCILLGAVPPSGSGILATVTFLVEGTGESALDLYDTLLLEFYFVTEIPHTVEDGYFSNTATHTLTVNSDPITGVDFTVDGTSHSTSWSGSLSEGSHTVVMPSTWMDGSDLYNFDHWEDASTNPTRIVSLTADKTVTAYYEYIPATHTLTVNSDPITGVEFTVDGTLHTTPWSDTLGEGSHTVVMPSSWGVYDFDHWEDASTNPTRIVSLTADKTVTAYFVKRQWTLSVDSSPITGVEFTVDGSPHTTPWSDSLDEGSYTVVMPSTWTIGEGVYNFDHWEDMSTNPTRIISLTTDKTATAYYALSIPQYELIIDVVGSGLTVPSPGTYLYDAGTEASVAALPDSGWMLDHWELDGFDVGDADPYNLTMNANHTLIAFFSEIPEQYQLTVDSDPINVVEFTVDGVTHTTPWSDLLDEGSYTVVMPSTWMDGSDLYNFDHWEDASTNPTRIVMLTSNMAIIAYYMHAPEPDFDISASPNSLTIIQGASDTSTITITSLHSFSSAVTLSVSGAPTGVTTSFDVNPVTPPSGGTATSTLTISVDVSTVTGAYTLTVTGTSGTLTHTVDVSLTVSLPPDFSISASPTSLAIAQGGSDTSTITIASLYGFTAPVDLTVSGVPSGVTATLNPEQVTPPADDIATSTLTVSVDPTVTPDTYTLTVTGTSGTLGHSIDIALVVIEVVPTKVYVDPLMNTAPPGESFTIDINVADVAGLSSWEVKLSWNATILYTDYGMIAEGDFLSNVGMTYLAVTLTPEPPAPSSVAIIGCMLLEPVTASGSGTLVTVEFSVIGEGECALNLYDTILLDVDLVEIGHTEEDGYFSTPPDFSISASPTSLTIAQGGSDTSTITITSLHGFGSAVTLSVSGAPAGVTTTFSVNPVTPPADDTTTSTLTVSVDPSTTPSTYTLTVTGTSGTLSHTVEISLTVTAALDFSISVSPTSLTIQQGSSDTATVTVTSLNGFNSAVSLSISGLPTGVTATFDPTSVTPPADATATSTLTITVDATTALDTYSLTITGTSGSLIHTTSLSLTITELPPEPDFNISASPNSLTIIQGESDTSTIIVTSLGGFSSPVTLSVSGAPTGVTTSFDVNPVTPPSSGTAASTLTISVDVSTVTGAYTLTVTGTSGTLTHTVDVSLTVSLPPDFSISASPTSLTIARGGSDTSTITVTSINGFNSAVTLSVSGAPVGVTTVFSANPITPPPDGTATSTLTMLVDMAATPGIYTLTVTGTSGTLSHSIDVTLEITESVLTIDNLIDLVEEFYELGYIDDQGVEFGLLDKLYAAEKQMEKGKTKTVGNILKAFINMVEAQSGKHIEVEAADILLEYANSLIQNL